MNRILWNERGRSIDEIVVENCTAHIEQMGDNCWWIELRLPDGAYWMGNFSTLSPRSRMQFTEQEGDITWDRDDTHEVDG